MNEGNKHSEYIDLIVKDLSGELNAEDQERLQNWLVASTNNKRLYDEYRKVWDEMDVVQDRTSRELETEWQRLQKAMDEPVNKPTKKTNPFLRIAASVVILITVGMAIFYILNQNTLEEVVAESAVQEIELPEGSVISLNLDSKISYPKKFESETREVKLEGEAFFEVAQDTSRPFIIKTDEVYVEVLGTAFNVRAYENEEAVEITVENGKVAVYRIGDKDNMVILVRGQKAVFRKELAELAAMENEDINYKSWKTRKIIFEDTPMSEVVRIVNDIYHTNLELSGTNLNECPVTTVFDNQSLETILSVLSSTLDLEITRDGQRIILSGAGC
jgi:transmembrane sensor